MESCRKLWQQPERYFAGSRQAEKPGRSSLRLRQVSSFIGFCLIHGQGERFHP
jgi:hypothetical protein